MNKEQYIKRILKSIKVTDKTKERIRYDIQTEIESMEEMGLTIEEIVLKKGSPKKVADEFNQSYSNTKMREWHYTQKTLKIAGAVLLSVSVLAFICNTLGSTFLMQDVSIIGGADGPTNIIVTEKPISYSPDLFARGNIVSCILLIFGIACVVIYYAMKKKK